MHRTLFLTSLLAAALVPSSVFQSRSSVIAQTAQKSDTDSKTQFASPSRDTALKYHRALQRRPNPGYLFDRFLNAWLDSSTIDELEMFLGDHVKKTDNTSDRLLLAFFDAKQGDDVKALQQFRTTLKNDPGNADVWYEKRLLKHERWILKTPSPIWQQRNLPNQKGLKGQRRS